MKLLAQIGKVDPILKGSTPGDPLTDLVKILNVALQLVMVGVGLFALFNFILAGWYYITSEGDTKKVQQAGMRITYTAIGLVIIVLTPLIAAIVGMVVFKRWDAILNPEIKQF